MGRLEYSRDWKQNGTIYIRAASTVNCTLPSEIKLIWHQKTLNNKIVALKQTSTELKLTNILQNNSGSYHYQILRRADKSILFMSYETSIIYVKCELREHIHLL